MHRWLAFFKINFLNRISVKFKMLKQIITKALKSRECARRKILFYKERKLIRDSPLFKERMQELESKSLMWKPRVEGRSIIINDQEVIWIHFI